MSFWMIIADGDNGMHDWVFVAGVYTDEQSARLAHQRLCTPVEQEYTVSTDFGMCLTEHTEATDDPCTIRFVQTYRNLGGEVGNDAMLYSWTETYSVNEIQPNTLLL